MKPANDSEFIRQFEACKLPAECFHHRDHVGVCFPDSRTDAKGRRGAKLGRVYGGE